MITRLSCCLAAVVLAVVVLCSCASVASPARKIVFVAGTPSHGHGEHEYRAGCLLLQKCLANIPAVQTVVYSNGWPADPAAFAGADAIVLSMDGSEGYDLLKDDHLQQLGALMNKGVGLACIHWAVEPIREKGEKELVEWLGGAFEVNWSVNPIWDADFTTLPQHPVTRGVKPFRIVDEWYFHLRFQDGMKGVTPLLAAVAPSSTMERPDGAHSGNPAVRQAVMNHEPQTVAWAYERPGGGRGFGFSGAHYHKNWGNDDFRKLVLNGLLWTAHVEVPPNGVESKISAEDLAQNLDVKGRKK
jgi:type 1 glutamine amidotransferase